MIFGGPREVESCRRAQDQYERKAKKPPQTMIHTTGSKLTAGYAPQPDDIVFTKSNVSWVHNPHEDALVITAEIANSLVH